MKKLILAAFALTTAAGVFAQGTVVLNNRISGASVNQTTHIWGPSSSTPGLSLIGLGSNDTPVGTTDFRGSGMLLIGEGGATGQGGYRTTFAQLIGATGASAPDSSLIPVGGTTTFRTGTSLGDVALTTVTITAPGFAADAVAPFTFQLVAWDNSSGNYATWAEASVAWRAGLIAAGHSASFGLTALGGTAPAPFLTQTGANLTSFNLYFVPEPSTFALAGLGAAALLIFRRRK